MVFYFSNDEYTDMMLVYGYCNCSARTAVREYVRRFPNRRIPDRRVFERVVRTMRETGRFPSASNWERFGGDVHDEQILNMVENSPTTSTRRMALRTGISRATISRRLHFHGLYPYHQQKIQHLLPTDLQARLDFCNWLRQNDDLLNKILFTDEATFTRSGTNNSRNSHWWSEGNPNAVVEANFQHRFSVNVWAGLLGKHLIGPYIINGRLTAEQYQQFLYEELPILLEDVPLSIRREMWLQQDGAPVHCARRVTAYLNEKYRGRWIGRGGP
jgi:Helix-turn-helix domain (DUF4817)/Transposase